MINPMTKTSKRLENSGDIYTEIIGQNLLF